MSTLTFSPFPYRTWSSHTPGDDLRVLERGVSARAIVQLADDLQVGVAALAGWLGVPLTSLLPLVRHERLPDAFTEAVLGVVKLVGQVEQSVAGASEEFNAAVWLGRWLQQPLPAIGNREPSQLLGTATGRAAVGEVLQRIVSSTYS